MPTASLPGYAKIWQLNVNNLTSVAEGGNIDNQRNLFAIKDLLISFATNPWTVHSSSNGSTTSSSDLWVDYEDLVWSTGNHSWIILNKPAVASTSQLLISLDTSTSNSINMYWSPGGLFTGGSISVDPTAIDQVTLQTNSAWNGSLSSIDGAVHVWHSEDGTKTRAVITNGTADPRFFLVMDTLEALPEYWGANTDVFMLFEGVNAMNYTGAAISAAPVINNFGKAYNGNSDIDIGLINMGGDAPPLARGTYNYFSRQGIGSVGAELVTNNPYFMTPYAVICESAGGYGVLGHLDDMYAGLEDLPSGTTYPSDSDNRVWVQFDEVILPWTSDSQQPLASPVTTIGSIPDLSASGNDGTAVNMIKRDFLVSDTPGGNYSQFAISTSGSDYISIGDVAELKFDRTDTFSLSGWFRTTETSGAPTLMSKILFSSGYEIILDAPNGTMVFQLINTTTTDHMRIDTTETFNDGSWYHIVATWDGDVAGGAAGAAIYINGTARTTSTVADTLSSSIDHTGIFQISGRTGAGSAWLGDIDDVAIYDKVLTPGEVSTIYNGGSPADLTLIGPTANLIGYWVFENILETTTADNVVDGMALLEGSGATETTYYVMIGIDTGAVSQPTYHTWTVTGSPDPTGAQTTPPFGGPLTNIHISATYTDLG